MKTAERVFGFASCALGLLPLLQPAHAQVSGLACQFVAVANGAASTTFPIIIAPTAGTKVLVCGYSISNFGLSSSNAQILFGYGSSCATANGFTQTGISVLLSTGNNLGANVSRNNLGITLAQGASVCGQSNASSTAVSFEVNYSLN